MTSILGFIGTIIAVAAYIPQIVHLIKERCSAGVSLTTYSLWIISSLLLLLNAISIRSVVFIVFQVCNFIAICIILFFGNRYKSDRCPTHKGWK
jgi:uncharacterized protein with PQ loop repeat